MTLAVRAGQRRIESEMWKVDLQGSGWIAVEIEDVGTVDVC